MQNLLPHGTRLMMCWETPNMKHIKLINVHTSFGAHWSVMLRDACLFSKWKLSPQTPLPSWHTPQPSFYLHLGDFVNIQCSASETEWPEKGHAQNFRKRSLWAKNCVRLFRGPTQLSLHVWVGRNFPCYFIRSCAFWTFYIQLPSLLYFYN